jgi:ankyrin repeat protein
MRYTALHEAADNGHDATVTLLLDRGADIETKNNVWHPNLMEDTVEGCMT